MYAIYSNWTSKTILIGLCVCATVVRSCVTEGFEVLEAIQRCIKLRWVGTCCRA